MRYAHPRCFFVTEVVIMSLNRALIIGNLGRDPEIRYTPTGMPVVNFSVATDESYVDRAGARQERVAWHRILVSGKLGLICQEHLKKERLVFVEGRIRYADWNDKSDGFKHHRTEIVAARVQFLGARSARGEGQEVEAPETAAGFPDSSEVNE
jgi:single-strand DNA-binding protein